MLGSIGNCSLGKAFANSVKAIEARSDARVSGTPEARTGCSLSSTAPGDVDLTKSSPPADPAVPLPESRKPAYYCFNGCM
jgi:hypothetical protein